MFLFALLALGCGTERLPNGFYVFRFDGQCCICSDSGTVVVDSSIAEYKIQGSEVTGGLTTGISFVLDTESATTSYSNGVEITRGNHVAIRELPNGYLLRSGGNHEYICTPRSNFLIGRSRLRDVIVDEYSVWAINFDGQMMCLDTSNGECKMQINGGNASGPIWATSTVTNPIVERNVPPPQNSEVWRDAFAARTTNNMSNPAGN